MYCGSYMLPVLHAGNWIFLFPQTDLTLQQEDVTNTLQRHQITTRVNARLLCVSQTCWRWCNWNLHHVRSRVQPPGSASVKVLTAWWPCCTLRSKVCVCAVKFNTHVLFNFGYMENVVLFLLTAIYSCACIFVSSNKSQSFSPCLISLSLWLIFGLVSKKIIPLWVRHCKLFCL